MKIAIVGAQGVDSFESNLKEAFVYCGHDCDIFDIYGGSFYWKGHLGFYTKTLDKLARAYNDYYDRNVFKRLANRVNDYNPDLILCVYRFIHPVFVNLVKKKGRKVVHINPDQITTLEYQQVFASDYDAWFVKDPYMQRFMSANMHLNVFRYNEAFNKRSHVKPTISKEACEKEVDIDVMTYGTFYPYRTRMIKCLLDNDINVKIFGVVPHRFYNHEVDVANQHKYITGPEKSKLLYGSKIVFNNLHYAEIEGVNCRFFEANGSGAFQLCDYRPVLKELLPIDPELVSFKNVNEAIEKISYYLNHPEQRYDIVTKVYNHFQEKYSYDNLIVYIMENSFK
ncbi:conserved domain protein [Fibrobacter succinogenes subsp. succinogenes S85]|uniref:Conserved domain protein n=1 Tax=Fibrobacter succinogenes (strain ATCC 19169 / S85) TaxID=59374 RepID=C9RN09_FIBSS|nr:glycosyltransferase [Fibrobacter succinogenes]ACX76261.1 conserved hypothetical protein [Fibrobacter succinogenes subsp. succinogenes S85]ADL25195.1 conserved domain protein [Fibrobacter succinogenes subsp. succinogenes S85]